MTYLKKGAILAAGRLGPDAVRRLCHGLSDAVLRARLAQITKMLDKFRLNNRQAGAHLSARDVRQYLAVELARRVELTPSMARVLLCADLDSSVEILHSPAVLEDHLLGLGLLRRVAGSGVHGGVLIGITVVGVEAVKLYRERQTGDLDLTDRQAAVLACDLFKPTRSAEHQLTRRLAERGLLMPSRNLQGWYGRTRAGEMALRLRIRALEKRASVAGAVKEMLCRSL